MEEWQELEDDESEEEIIPEPDREDKLQTYLQLAAAGHSPIDYVRETSGLPIEDRSFLLEPPDSESEIFTQEEASVEVDALGDEVEESEPVAHPGHRSRSLDLIKSHSYPSSSSIFDPPDLADDNDSREDVDENDENANPLLPLADLPEDTPVASHAERHGELRAIADVEQGTDFSPEVPEVPSPAEDRQPDALVLAIPETAADAAGHAAEDAELATGMELATRDDDADDVDAVDDPGRSRSVSPEQSPTSREAHMRAAAVTQPPVEVNPILKSLQPKNKQDMWSKIHGGRQPRAVPSLRPPGSQRGQASSSRSPK